MPKRAIAAAKSSTDEMRCCILSKSSTPRIEPVAAAKHAERSPTNHAVKVTAAREKIQARSPANKEDGVVRYVSAKAAAVIMIPKATSGNREERIVQFGGAYSVSESKGKRLNASSPEVNSRGKAQVSLQ
jgi:hypothetical protein